MSDELLRLGRLLRKPFAAVSGLPVRRHLWIGAFVFQGLLFTVTVAAVVSLVRSSNVLNSIVSDTVVRIGRLNEIIDLLNARQTNLAVVLATSDQLVVQYEMARHAETVKATALVTSVLLKDTPDDRRIHVEELEQALASIAELEQRFAVEINAGRKLEAEILFVRGVHAQSEAAREAVRTSLKAEEDAGRSESIRQASENVRTVRWIILLTFVCLVAGTAVAFILARSVGSAYEEVQALKLQQDGDYFLTALLQGQLARDYIESPRVRMKSTVQQYKRFQFKGRSYSIGGDFCCNDTITLRGRTFAVFLNADAMGKSMQGAGGALVVGALFRAILERTKLTSAAKSIYPERWLKNAITEIHSVFSAFEGSMLVSLILGLIDEQSGTMFYVNAAHPHPVLYREGTACFLQNAHHLHKAGTPGELGSMSVKSAQLRTGDVVIVGSDGRDEIRMTSKAVVNTDESLFLRFVESGEGDIGRIRAAILEAGALTDDLSLSQIQMVAHDLEGSESGQALELRALAADRAQIGDYATASDYLERLSDLSPSDQDLFTGSVCARKAGRLATALDLGERLRLRRPDVEKNLVHLARIYLLTGDASRARMLAEEVIRSQPENIQAHRVIDKARSLQAGGPEGVQAEYGKSR